MTSTGLATERRGNRKNLLKILSDIRFLARQVSAFRGDWCTDTGSEKNSNFQQLLFLRSEDDKTLINWLERHKVHKYTSPRFKMK